MRTRYTLFKSDSEPIVIIMGILLVVGLVNVFSSSYVLAAMDFENPYFFLGRHALWSFFGIIACVICRKVDYRKWRGLMFVGLGVTLFLLVAVLFVGTTVNGAQRWISLGPLSFQPAEFAKLMAVLMGAFSISSVLSKEDFYIAEDWPRVVVPFGAILVMAFLVYREPDFGTACIVFGVPLLMAIVLLVRPRFWSLIGLVGGAVALGIGALQPYRMKRILVWIDPWSDARDAGYQMVQSLSTIGSGGIFGMGFGDGVSKYEFGQVLALGIVFLVLGQALANLAMVAGVLPVVGVPLPFISYGGSSLVVTMAGMGMLLGIADRNDRASDGDAPQRRGAEEEAEERRRRMHVVR